MLSIISILSIITAIIFVIWIFLAKKSAGKQVKWRDECTSKELTSVLVIPNRDHKYEDLPEYTSSQYLPDVDKLVNKPEKKINELTMLIEPPPKELLVSKPRRMM